MARTTCLLFVEDLLDFNVGMWGLGDALSSVVQTLQDVIQSEWAARAGAGCWKRLEGRSGMPT